MDESKISRGTTTPVGATLSVPAGRASRSPSPARGEEQPTSGMVGPASPVPFAWFDPATSSVKTSQASFLTTRADTSVESSVTWPRSGSMRSGRCWQRTKQVRPTGGNGCGSWPTPTAQAHRRSRGSLIANHWSAPGLEQAIELANGILPRELENENEMNRSIRAYWPTPTAGDAKASGAEGYSTEGGRHSGTTLTDAAVRWPTPTAQPYGTNQGGSMGRTGPMRPSLEGGVKDWPRPRATAGTKGGPNQTGSHGDSMLPSGVNWPTPTASDGTGGPAYARPPGREGGPLLKEAMRGGVLNPRWVEALMGWPLRLLSLGLPSVVIGQLRAELRSYRGSRRGRSLSRASCSEPSSSPRSETVGASPRP
jgi:hypothetical protein